MKGRHFKHRKLELAYYKRKFEFQVNRKGRKYDPNRPRYLKKKSGQTVITAPDVISIYEYRSVDGSKAYDETIQFLEEIAKNFRKRECLINFGNTHRVSAAAMLLVYAAFDKVRTQGTAKAEIFYSRLSGAVNKVIKRTNLASLIENPNFTFMFRQSETLPVVSGASSHYIDDIVDHIQYQIYGNKMEDETEYAYGDAVSETINNVNRHAYPNETDSEKKLWWVLCEVIDKNLYLAIYDSGVGIPKTVVEKTWFTGSLKQTAPKLFGKLAALQPDIDKTWILPHIYDSVLIHLSMQGDITGTGLDKHGQGSKSIKKLVSECSHGKLWVYSNGGIYIFRKEDSTPLHHNLPSNFPGTLIQWNIKLP